jgi:hypothetical protein
MLDFAQMCTYCYTLPYLAGDIGSSLTEGGLGFCFIRGTNMAIITAIYE